MPTFYFYEPPFTPNNEYEDPHQILIYMERLSPSENSVYMGRLEIESNIISTALQEFIVSLGKTCLDFNIKQIAINPDAWLADYRTE